MLNGHFHMGSRHEIGILYRKNHNYLAGLWICANHTNCQLLSLHFVAKCPNIYLPSFAKVR